MSALLMKRQSSALSDQNDDIEQSAVSEKISQNIMMNSSYVSNQMKKICSKNRLNPEFIQIDQNLPQNMILSQYTQQQLIREIDGQYSFMRRSSSIGTNCQSCSICLNKITNPIIIQPCNHTYCSQCLLEHIYNKIITGEVSIISCPGIICNIELDEDFIKSLIDEELFKKFKRFKRLKLYENNTNGRWCPKPDCENFVFRNSTSLTLICTCGQSFCFKCGNQIHQGKSCEETVDQAFSQAIIQYKIYNCPNCKAHIQKNEGCNHMFCTKCGYEFCWLCRMQYTSKHYNCLNPISCPGEQHLNRDPYPFPRLLIAFRALLKITLYLLCSPILISVGCLVLLYLILIGLYKCIRHISR